MLLHLQGAVRQLVLCVHAALQCSTPLSCTLTDSPCDTLRTYQELDLSKRLQDGTSKTDVVNTGYNNILRYRPVWYPDQYLE
jgi:hypothetical protein